MDIEIRRGVRVRYDNAQMLLIRNGVTLLRVDVPAACMQDRDKASFLMSTFFSSVWNVLNGEDAPTVQNSLIDKRNAIGMACDYFHD